VARRSDPAVGGTSEEWQIFAITTTWLFPVLCAGLRSDIAARERAFLLATRAASSADGGIDDRLRQMWRAVDFFGPGYVGYVSVSV